MRAALAKAVGPYKEVISVVANASIPEADTGELLVRVGPATLKTSLS
jgi:hypothetical protein